MNKNYTEADGKYDYISNHMYPKNIITLTGTSPTLLQSPFSSIIGAFFFSIYSRNPGGPCANVVLTKSDSTLNTGSVSILNSSPGTSLNAFNFSWLANSGISVNKTNTNNNGEYVILNNFENQNSSQDITLTGTGSVQIGDFSYYDKKSMWIRVTPSISGGPHAVFSVSKNSNTRAGNIIRYSSPGISSGTNLSLTWGINSGLFINKSNNNYNGVYSILFQ
jgi:hypothetical protein